MLTIEECKTIDPSLAGLSDQQIIEIRDALYLAGKLALQHFNDHSVSKNPNWLMPSTDNSTTIKLNDAD